MRLAWLKKWSVVSCLSSVVRGLTNLDCPTSENRLLTTDNCTRLRTMKNLITAILMTIVTTILFGLIYPLW